MTEKIYDLNKGDALPASVQPRADGKKWFYFERYNQYKQEVFAGKVLEHPDIVQKEIGNNFFCFKKSVTPTQEVWLIVSPLKRKKS